MARDSRIGITGGGASARARSNSAAAAKAVAPKKSAAPTKVAKLIGPKRTKKGALIINTNPVKPKVVVKPVPVKK